MEIEVFDDKVSVLHFIAGLFTCVYPVIFILFLFYELIEFMYRYRKRRGERVKKFIGDLVEYLLGLSMFSLVSLFYQPFFLLVTLSR